MGFLKNIFNGGNSGKPAKTAILLDEDLYWQIVAESRQAGNTTEQEQYLIGRLEQLTTDEIIGFKLRTDRLLRDTYTSEMWCAAYIMNGGCSDDGFEYFRNWVISRGREVYYNATNNPDTLVEVLDEEGDEGFEFESYSYVALTAFENKTGKDLYDYIDDNSSASVDNAYPKINFTWEEENPESMKAICPVLFENKWDKY